MLHEKAASNRRLPHLMVWAGEEMQSSANDPVEDPPTSNIPDDVAALYLWANLGDATYRDFSASRRKLRAQRGQPAELASASPHLNESPTLPVFETLQAPPTPQVQGETAPEAQDEPEPVYSPYLEPDIPTAAFLLPSHFGMSPPGDELFLLQEPAITLFPGEGIMSYPAFNQPTQAPEPTIHDQLLPTPAPQPGSVPELLPSRWHSLGVPMHVVRSAVPAPAAVVVPILAVFAPTAGAGKTALVATLGRALSALGESVALAETSPQSSLSTYFDEKDFHPGAVRVLSPASGSSITLVSYNVEAAVSNAAQQVLLAEQFLSLGATTHRLLLDLTERAGSFLRHLILPQLTVLIPVTPTMSSVISLQAVERFFRELAGPDAQPLEPFYLIVQFDESQLVHRDVRDFLSRRVGDRLLPMVIRSASGVSQAFAQHMTVVDYAPNSPIAADYQAVAKWLRTFSPPAVPVSPPPSLPTSRWATS